MPVITRSGGGKVTAIWGGAQIRDQHGKMQPLHVGDLVKLGDVILTTQNGIVRISDGANPVAAAKTTEPSDTDRVIAGLNQGDLDIAPGAGLVGGDGGSLSEGFRVGRIAEGVTPASMGLPQYEESTIEDLANEIRAEVVPLGDGIPETPVEPPSPPPPPPVGPPATVSLSASQDFESDSAGYTFTATLSAASQGRTTIVTDQGVITIEDGQTSGSITVGVGSNPDDVYVDPTSLMATITSASGGNFGPINVGTGSAEASIVDTITPVTTSLGTAPPPPAPTLRFALARSFFVDDAPPEAPFSLSTDAFAAIETQSTVVPTKLMLSATLSAPSQGDTTITTDLPDGNGSFRKLIIADGEMSGSIEIEIDITDDVYIGGYTINITSASGGNFEFIDLSSGSASTTITITDSLVPVIIRLTATPSVTEGGYIVYTASLENNASLPDLVTGSPLVIQLDNGTTITIPVGFDSASSGPVAVRADDYYVQGTGTVTATITGTSGGDFERLDYVTFGSASTLVNDDFDTTTVQLLSTRQDGSGNYVVIASIDNAPDESPLVLTLSNGATVTFEVGRTTAESTAVAVPKVGPSATVSVTSAEGGNFEALNTEDTVVAPLDISVDIPVVTPITNPLGLNVEYYGYNDFNPTGGNANRQHLDDGTFGNLDSVADVTALINARNVYYGGGNVVGSTVATQDNATDVRFTATTLDYGRINAVNNSLGTNPDVAAGAGSPITINRTNSELFKFVNKTPASAPIDLRVTLGTPDSDNLGSGPTSGLGKTSDAAMRFTGQAYLNAGLYDIRVTADAGFRLQLDDQTVAIFDGVQTATTRVYSGVAIEGGLTPLELLYWDEGSKAVLRVEFKLSGDLDSSYKVLGSGTLPLFSDVNAPVLTELQDIVTGARPGSYTVRTGSLLQGGAGDDQLTGGDARDHLIGGDGRDVLAGGAASDVIEGGQGDDLLTGDLPGGMSNDVFRWSLGDASSTATPAHDVISDFDNTSYAGDVLDLRDLLTGETHAANTTTLPNPIGLNNALTITSDAGNLADYLHFTKVGSDTVIEISSEGKFTAGSHAAVDQVITLTGVNLVGSFTNDSQIINDLLARGKLITDVA